VKSGIRELARIYANSEAGEVKAEWNLARFCSNLLSCMAFGEDREARTGLQISLYFAGQFCSRF